MLHRRRELQPPPRRPRARASRRTRCSTTSPRTSCSSSTRATSPCPSSAASTTGTASRKGILVEHGFRLPVGHRQPAAALRGVHRADRPDVFLSATPGPYELERVRGDVVEQVIRPTGLVDPEVDRQADQGPDRRPDRTRSTPRVGRRRAGPGHHADQEDGRGPDRLPARGRASGSGTCTRTSTRSSRIEILRELRLGEFDVLVGINLLREGLDLPEVSLVAILDADKEGFLRSATSLIQTIGRAARNVDGPGGHVRRRHHRLDAPGHRRDPAAARAAERLQPRARDRPPDDPQGGHRHPRPVPGRGLVAARRDLAACRSAATSERSRRAGRRAVERLAGPVPEHAGELPADELDAADRHARRRDAGEAAAELRFE